jgi:hypothetical protein
MFLGMILWLKNNANFEEGIELSAESLERLLLKGKKDENTHIM